jgi:FkbM family methyltransferase
MPELSRILEIRPYSLTMRKAAMRWLQISTGAVILFGISLLIYPAAWAYALIAIGRGPDCPWPQSYGAFSRRYAQKSAEQRAMKTSYIVQRDGTYQLVHTAKGPFWEAQVEGSSVVAQLAEIEAKYRDFPGRPIRRGDVVLDCGANVGTFTREALLEGAGLVVAVEPAPKNVECLRRNFAAETAAGRVIIYPKGVWDKDDFLTLDESDSTPAMDSFVRTEGTHPGTRVALTTIDKMADELKLERVDFIKMDIEGAEQRALAGARRTLSQNKPRLEISVNHLPDDARSMPEIIKSARRDYTVQCLQCEAHPQELRVRSEILYFQ